MSAVCHQGALQLHGPATEQERSTFGESVYREFVTKRESVTEKKKAQGKVARTTAMLGKWYKQDRQRWSDRQKERQRGLKAFWVSLLSRESEEPRGVQGKLVLWPVSLVETRLKLPSLRSCSLASLDTSHHSKWEKVVLVHKDEVTNRFGWSSI